MKNINLYQKYRPYFYDVTLDCIDLLFHKTIFLNDLAQTLRKNL